MLDYIIFYYKRELDSFDYALKKCMPYFVASIVLILITIVCLNNQTDPTNKSTSKVIAYSILTVFSVVLSMYKRDSNQVKFIQHKFNVGVSRKNAYKLSKHLESYYLHKFLQSINCASNDDIDNLIKQLESRINRKKLPGIILPGVIGGLFYPIWSSTVGKLVTPLINVENVTVIIIVSLLAIWLATFLLGYVKASFAEAKKTLFDTELQTMQKIIYRLEDIQFMKINHNEK